MAPERRDVIVIGHDLWGLIFAQLAASNGHSVDVFFSYTDRPSSPGYLESGLLDLNGDVDSRGYYDGIQMLEYFGYPRPARRSILCFGRSEEESHFLNHARARGLLNRAVRLDRSQARAELGVFFTEGRTHFHIPDVPFPLGELAVVARATAEAWGVRFRAGPVSLEPDHTATCGYTVNFNGARLDPAMTAVAAGAATSAFVDQLHLGLNFVVNQSLELEVDGSKGLPAPLLTDASNGMIVTSLNNRESPPNGRLIIRRHYSRRIRVAAYDAAPDTVDEKQLLLSYASSFFSIADVAHRFVTRSSLGMLTNGDAKNQPVYNPSEFPGLFFATAGNPMQSVKQARSVFSILRTPRSGRRKAA